MTDDKKVITPLKKNRAENVKVIARELEYQGVSVIISRREFTLNYH